jgi:hypothetical protein
METCESDTNSNIRLPLIDLTLNKISRLGHTYDFIEKNTRVKTLQQKNHNTNFDSIIKTCF